MPKTGIVRMPKKTSLIIPDIVNLKLKKTKSAIHDEHVFFLMRSSFLLGGC